MNWSKKIKPFLGKTRTPNRRERRANINKEIMTKQKELDNIRSKVMAYYQRGYNTSRKGPNLTNLAVGAVNRERHIKKIRGQIPKAPTLPPRDFPTVPTGTFSGGRKKTKTKRI